MHAPRFIVVCLLIVAPACLRMLTFEWNVVPIGALALFCGAHFRNRTLAFSIPLLSMFLGDILLAVQTHNSQLYLFHTLMPFVYGCYILSVAMGIGLRSYWDRLDEGIGRRQTDSKARSNRKYSGFWTRVVPIASLTVTGSILFFVVTNFGCWWLFSTYPKSWSGLLECYIAAIPYFRGTLGGDLIGSAILFGGDQLLRHDAMAVPQSERF
jgi:prepilin signal peptidase PulO-like enzyme (type II secretory pathway)